ncbi:MULTISPECIES: hypothetical protein [Elizabethkingia]|uniref:Uncharacterized protein n=4 Tax=Elizabethkingia anophelis TaxID=1117645 RepID=A0A085CJR2_9FLAO|nr:MULTISPECIES: hypothetical protein [Elizabethkingia]AIL45081.1 hypothetical protein BD94_1306 [Elizabethkingia anophelis NUHP1]AKH93898.1 hypothetical protein M876_04870 [Elizabethkingia anophelis FMS-007]AMR40146.1 hypothetical protein A2T74_01695 [Elizabethkingia anophelis]AMX46780.1 hypothetical protein A4C56_01695 [Elizabethkingia anophelis]AMX50243.1 hypothetical protein A2T72_01695 [Elizabethkingia anophelis]
MKRIILPLAVFALVVSCNKKTETTTTTSTDSLTTKTESGTTTSTTTTEVKAEVPKFSNEDVNKGLAEYQQLLTDYKTAIANKDQAKLTELAAKFQTWSQGAAAWASKLKPEEQKQFSDYLMKASKEWTDAAQSAAK